MKQALIDWLKANAGKHIEALVIAGALIFVGRLWLQEHDARLQADATVKTAQTTIDAIKQQQTAVRQTAAKEVIVLQKEAAAVKTPAQAVTALTRPSADMAPVVAPLEVTALPDAPDQVAVEALPLDKVLNGCRQDSVNLTACTKELSLEKQIDAQKDVQITALKAKPNFWHRLGKAAKVIGCAGAGGAVGSYLKGGQGAALGAAAGAGICEAF